LCLHIQAKNIHSPIEASDPIEEIKIRMEEMQLRQIDVVDAIGGKAGFPRL
jgi:HTH-type transcriptional regulator / antitoxin HigA